MIYQLKITLQHISPPIWRRIQVDSNTTFETLHELLQIAFDWTGYHLHTFEVKHGRYESIYIEPLEKEVNSFFDLSFHEKLEERKVPLAKFLKKEKDKCIYTYDFGDDWKHEIVLEKILELEPGIAYPRCIKAMRLAPEEDSGMEFWSGEATVIETDNKALAAEINEMFQPFQKTGTKHSKNNTKNTNRASGAWHELFENATQLKKLKPWEWLEDDQIIVVQLPDTGEYAYCSVLGKLGEEFGVAIYIGNAGLISLQSTVNGMIDFEDLLAQQRSILVSFSDRDELETPDYDIIKNLGLSFRGQKQWPMFRSFKPGYYPWFIDEEEVKMASVVLKQVADAAYRVKMGEISLPSIFEEKWFARIPVKTGDIIEWQDGFIAPKIQEEEDSPIPLFVSEFELAQLRKQVTSRFNAPIEFGSFNFHEPIQDDIDTRPYFPKVIIGVERKNGMVIYHKMTDQTSFEEQFQQAFLEMIKVLEKIPREVWVEGTQCYRILEPVFKTLSIKGMQVETLRGVEEVRSHMLEFGM